MSNEMPGKQYEMYKLHREEYRLTGVLKGVIHMEYIGEAGHILGVEIQPDGHVTIIGDPRGNI